MAKNKSKDKSATDEQADAVGMSPLPAGLKIDIKFGPPPEPKPWRVVRVPGTLPEAMFGRFYGYHGYGLSTPLSPSVTGYDTDEEAIEAARKCAEASSHVEVLKRIYDVTPKAVVERVA